MNINDCVHPIVQFSNCDGVTDSLYCNTCGNFIEAPCAPEGELYDCLGNHAVHAETVEPAKPLWEERKGQTIDEYFQGQEQHETE